MYRLMIVDDEYLSRYTLRTLIEKKFSNIEIVGEAENGRQAILLNRKLQPEIIIMDIKMPGINGIDASVEIIGEFPETNILILTAYDNFEYIKRALDIGVKGYILKPVKELEVVEKINKVLNQINERTNRSDFMEMVETKIKVVKPFMEDELITAFITGNCDTGKIENYISFLQEDIRAGYFLLISAGQNYSNEINDSIRNRILKEKVLNIVTRHLPLMKKCFFGKTQGNSIVVFIPVDLEFPTVEVVREAIMIGQEVKRKLKVIGDVDAAIGIGKAYSNIQDFSKSYNEAVISLRKAAVEKKVIHFESLSPDVMNADKTYEYPLELESKLAEQLMSGNIRNAKRYADEILMNILEKYSSPHILKENICEFITVLKRTVSRIGINPDNPGSSEILSELAELSSVDEIEIWCKRNVYNLIEQVEKGGTKNTDIISRVFDYSNRNFNKDITLELAAAEVGLTPQYLSKVFKEKCGTNFIDYITKKRLEYAEELLKKCDKNIKEISKMAGYEDSNYFCKIFKKETGLSPKQYRTKASL